MKNLADILAQWVIDAAWVNSAAEKAAEFGLVTLDIFDTALTRDTESPFDIFARAEHALSAENKNFRGFAAAREQAEEEARRQAFLTKRTSEVTLAEIYAALPQFLPLAAAELASAKARELAEEELALAAVPDILALADKLEKIGRAYAFVSDMYLPTEFLEKILRREGYGNPQFCAVSAAVGKSKAAGSIWQIPALRGKSILHIGDNPHSDSAEAQKHGIKTLYYGRARSAVRTGYPLSPAVLPFSKAHRLSIMAARSTSPAAEPTPAKPKNKEEAEKQKLAEQSADMRQNYILGQSFGALILGSFILWLKERAQKNGISHLLFCARDGYLMQQAWHILTDKSETQISDSYLYVSRNILLFSSAYLTSSENKLSAAITDFLTWRLPKTTVGDIMQRMHMLSPALAEKAGQILGRKSALMRRRHRPEKYAGFLQEESAALYRAFGRYHHEVMSYFIQEGVLRHKKIGLVDMGWAGTMQRSLRQLCSAVKPDFSCVGFFYGLSPVAPSNLYLSGHMESAFFNPFEPPQNMEKNWQGVGLLEELHNPPEGTAQRIIFKDGAWQPQTKKSAARQKEYDTFIAPFQQGALHALREIALNGESGCGLKRADLTPQNALAAYRLVFLSPTNEEIAALSKISHGMLPDHCDEMPMHNMPLPHLRKNYPRVLYNFDWRFALMKTWLQQAAPRQKRALKRLIGKKFTDFSPRELRFLYHA